MTGLLDIAPASEVVNVRGSEVTVSAISITDIAAILKRFPDVRKVLAGRNITVESLFELVPEAIIAVIAAGAGHAGNEEAEKKVASLSIDDQFALLTAIFKITFREGVGPFVARLRALGVLGDAAGATTKVPATNSPSPSTPSSS